MVLSITCCAIVVTTTILVAAVAVNDDGTPLLEPVPGAERPDVIERIPLYRDFYDRTELYRRLHVVIDRVERDPKVPQSLLWQANSPEAYVSISTVGNDTGSTHYFEIGSYQTKTVDADNSNSSLGFPRPLYVWDEKALILYKINGTDEIDFTILDKDVVPGQDDLLMEFTLPVSDLPEPDQDYVELRRSHNSSEKSTCDEMEGSQLVFLVKVTEMSRPFTSTEDNVKAKSSIVGKLDYQEHVLDLDLGENALLQSWTHTDNEQEVDGAVLWVIGRNDCFMHPHVLNKLFLDGSGNRYDVFVLNWRYNGLSRFRGFLTDAYFNTHVKNGTFDPYIQEIELSLELMLELSPSGEGYNTIICYAHSTGGPLVLNYLVEKGDDAFDAFLFNSPFLDWAVGGDSALLEFVENALSNFLAEFELLEDDFIFSSKTTPEELGLDIIYLNRSVAPSVFSARIYSQYRVDWAVRNLYRVPVTAGFAKAVARVHKKIGDAGVITTKPMLVLKSRADKVLIDFEIDKLSGIANPEREVFGFDYNSHDVFLSGDDEDTVAAIGVAKEWLSRTKVLLSSVQANKPTSELTSNTAAPTSPSAHDSSASSMDLTGMLFVVAVALITL